jgi:hypothetical protein
MPDPKVMSGIPRPVDDLPKGAISVRLIRGQLSNNITGHPVELHVGSKVLTVKTDENGRAQFNDVTPGATLKAAADVDGEHLESQEFPAPSSGGIRLMLVATDTSKGAAPAPSAPAVAGSVVIGDQSRIVMQPADESVEVFYLFDVSNNAAAPVNPSVPFVIDLPKNAGGAAIMDGSSPQASVTGTRVAVEGPFAPGHTFVQVAFAMRADNGSLEIAQTLPANLEQLAVVVKKVGTTTLSSRQIKEQRDLPANGEVFIAATGGAVAAGQPLTLSLSDIPHHSSVPRRIAITLALGIALLGAWAATRPTGVASAQSADRKRLVARRDKLFNDLVRLENDRRTGRTDDRRYAARREDLIAALEQVYNGLENHDLDLNPAGSAGFTAPVGGLGSP